MLARCNAGGVDAGNKLKFLSEEFHPIREALVDGNNQVRTVEGLKREYWDQKEEADADRASANKAQKDVEKAQEKQEKTQEKYLALHKWSIVSRLSLGAFIVSPCRLRKTEERWPSYGPTLSEMPMKCVTIECGLHPTAP